MKLTRHGQAGHEKPGLIDEEVSIRGLSAVVDDIAGGVLTERSLAVLRKLRPSVLPKVDEVLNPQNLAMTLSVNGHQYQNGNSRTMVFGVAPLIGYISRYMTLAPGDVISAGTPSAVGLGQKPPVYLRPGDFIVVPIERLGCQRQRVVAAIWDTSPSGV
jgi:hypothetical protein